LTNTSNLSSERQLENLSPDLQNNQDQPEYLPPDSKDDQGQLENLLSPRSKDHKGQLDSYSDQSVENQLQHLTDTIPEPQPPSTSFQQRVRNTLTNRSNKHRYAAKLILQQIQKGLIGCTDAQHQFQDTSHHVHSQGNHFPLDITYTGVGAFSNNIGLYTDNFRANQGVSRRSLAPSTPSFTELFTGIDSTSSQHRNVCLHLEQPSPTFPHVSSDVDSLIAFPTSLAALRTEFYYCPTLQYKRKFTTDVHIDRTIFYPSLSRLDKPTTLQLREIPHLYLGPVSGIYDCSVYVFFPRLYSKDHVFESLTDQQMLRFTDYIILESIHEHLPDATTQHIPPGFQVSQLNASAQANEIRTGVQESTSKTNHAYLIQSSYLQVIWDTIQSRISQANFQEYSDAFLCVMSKGHKLQFQGQDSFPLVIKTFYNKLRTMFDYTFLRHDDLYIDIATEICPNYSSYTVGEKSEAQVYLFKRCCLEKSLEAFYNEEPLEATGTTQFYHVKFLYQACNMTHVPPKRSRVFQGGLRYIQCYAVEKEISDAGTIYPFANPNLAELCLDPGIWASAASAARWKGKKSRERLVESYCQSKRRVRYTYHDSCAKSFGVRAEYRVTSTLLLAILDEYQEQAIIDPSVLTLPSWGQTPSFT
jgi:hypothetical protein